ILPAECKHCGHELPRAGEFGKLPYTRIAKRTATRPLRSLGTHPPKKVANFCQLFGGAGVRRRAGNIPASDHGTPTFTVSRAMPFQTIRRQDPAGRRRWGESAPTPIQLSRARRGVWKAPADAHSDDSVAHPLSRFCRGQRCATTEERGRRVTGFRELFKHADKRNKNSPREIAIRRLHCVEK